MPAQTYDDFQTEFTTFAGCDITAVFGSKVIGSIQSVTYSVKREVAPIFTLGSPDPRSFSRGKRGIAGSLVFTMFNKEPLISSLVGEWGAGPSPSAYGTISTAVGNTGQGLPGIRTLEYLGIDAWNSVYNSPGLDIAGGGNLYTKLSGFGKTGLLYGDQILPFNVNIFMKNEFGAAAVLNIIGIQIINEGMGFSVDDITTEKAYSFVARAIWPMRPLQTQ